MESASRDDSLKRNHRPPEDNTTSVEYKGGKIFMKKKDNKVVKLIRYDSQKEFEKRQG